MTAKTFGRRASAAPVRREAKAPAAAPATPAPEREAAPEPTAAAAVAAVGAPAPEMSVDEELRRWKEQRQQTLFTRLPWKQFSLFASISFGVASFVLPDDVNDAVDYLLWGLSLITFAIWMSGFFNKKPAP
jgi:hypothetical protein